MKRIIFIFTIVFLSCSGFIFSQTPSQGLIGYWPFTGNSNDLSGYNNNGIVNGATLTADRFGNSNNAYFFSGVGDFIDCGYNIPTFTNQLTVSVWIKTNTSVNSVAYIVGKYGWPYAGIAKGFHILFTNMVVQFSARDEIDKYNMLTSGDLILNDDNWHHIVGVINNSIYELWIDGIKIAKMDNHHVNVDLSQQYNLYVGGHFNGGEDKNMYFNGAIDDIRLYNRALDQNEILQLLNEGKITYPVTTSSLPPEGGITTGDGNYSSGQYVTVKATPMTGYLFVNWKENNIIVDTNPTHTFIMTNNNRNLVANFNRQYSVTTECNPFSGGTVKGAGNYVLGDTVKIIATPNKGYIFVNLTEKGYVISSKATHEFVIERDREFVVNFSAILYNISSSPNPVEGGTTTGNGSFFYGQTAELTANPKKGFSFVGWTEAGKIVDTSKVYRFLVEADRNLIANFTINKYTIVTAPNPPNSGTATGSGVYNYGENVAIVARPHDGFYFINWTENNKAISVDQNYQFNVESNRNFTANFATIPSLKVSPEFVQVGSDSGSGAFNVFNASGGTMPWKARSNASWIIIVGEDSGINDGVINFKYRANKLEARTSSITVTSEGSINSPLTVEIRQDKFTGVGNLNLGKPTEFDLFQNYPNPFNPTTTIEFSLPISTMVILKVYNSLGQETAELVNKELPASFYSINFDASKLNSGIYFYRISAGPFTKTKKLILMK